MARYGDQGAFQSPGHMFHKAGFATTGGSFEQYRDTVVVSGFKDLYFFPLSRVERFLRNKFCLCDRLIHDAVALFVIPCSGYR